jgi:hypothetical protein
VGSRMRGPTAYVCTAVLSLLIVWFVLRLWQADLHVPLDYYRGGDTLSHAALVKSVVETGWFLHNPRVGAPGSLSMEDYPLADNLPFLIVKILSIFSSDWAVVINLYFILTFPLTALTALFAMRHAGVSYLSASAFSILYACLPFHFLRGQAHLLLASYYVVPLAALAALQVARGKRLFTAPVRQEHGLARFGVVGSAGAITLATAVLVGAGAAYFALFSIFLMVVAGAAASARNGSWRSAVPAIVLVGVMFASLLLNLAPSIIYRLQHGPNPAVAARSFVDAEAYSLRITQLVLPISGHRLPLFARMRARYNASMGASVNENDTSALGLVGTCGFCILLGALLFASPVGDNCLRPLSILNVSAVLLATTSGFGTLVAMEISPQIRAYCRICVFVAFFALLAAAIAADAVRAALRHHRWATPVYSLMLLTVLFGGTLDQTASYFAPPYGFTRAQYRGEEAFIRRVESAVPPGSMVFQLPYVPYPEAPAPNRMSNYDLLRAYLHSKSLRWSYGAMRGRWADLWQRDVASLSVPEMTERLAYSGFSGISIDRYGYSGNPPAIEGGLSATLGPPVAVSDSGRWAFYSLSRLAAKLRASLPPQEWQRRQYAALRPVLADWSGCYGQEMRVDGPWRWCPQSGVLSVENLSTRSQSVRLDMILSTGHAVPYRMSIRGPQVDERLDVTRYGARFVRIIRVPPGKAQIQFRSDAPRVDAPNDPRYMVFGVSRFSFTLVKQ